MCVCAHMHKRMPQQRCQALSPFVFWNRVLRYVYACASAPLPAHLALKWTFKKRFIFICVYCEFVSSCALCEIMCTWSSETGSSGTGVRGNCEPIDVGASKWTGSSTWTVSPLILTHLSSLEAAQSIASMESVFINALPVITESCFMCAY